MKRGIELEEDYQLALQKFWQPTGHLRRGNKCPINTVYRGSEKLLISSGDTVSNPTGTASVEEEEAEEFDSIITQN